jgi:hypothetical protein
MRDRLRLTVFEDDEVFRSEIRNVPSGGVRDGGVDLNEIDGNPNDRILRRALRQYRQDREGQPEGAHGPCLA